MLRVVVMTTVVIRSWSIHVSQLLICQTGFHNSISCGHFSHGCLIGRVCVSLYLIVLMCEPHTFCGWAVSIGTTPYHKLDSWNIMRNILKITLDIILNSSHLYSMAWCDVRRRNALTGMTLRRYRTCRRQNQRTTSETGKEVLRDYADRTYLRYRPS